MDKKKLSLSLTRRAVLKSGASASVVMVSGCGSCGTEPLMRDAGAGTDGGVTGGADASSVLADAGRADASSSFDDAGWSGTDDAGFSQDAGGRDAGESMAADAGAEDAGADDAGNPALHPMDFDEDDVFDLGVTTGLDEADMPWAWTRIAASDPAAALTFVVWPAADPEAALQLPVSPGDMSLMGVVAQRIFMPVPNVLAGETYAFCFVRDEISTRSAVGRFRVPDALETSETVKLVVSSCTHHNAAALNVLGGASQEAKIDAVVLMGDTVYADGSSSYADYQSYWSDALSREEYKDTRNQAVVLAAWDDHEVDNNFDPETIDTVQLTNARDAFFDHQPLVRLADDADRIWRAHQFGSTVEVIMLDCRSERLPSTRNDADAQYISPAQMAWLKSRLSTSPCRFKLIVNTVPITDLPLSFNTDKWEGYPAARNDILSYIDTEDIPGVIWVSGDVHFAAAGRVGKEGDLGENQIEIIVGPGAQLAPNPQGALCQPPQFDYGQAVRNFGTLEFDPVVGTVTCRHIGQNGVLSALTYTL